MSVDKLEKTANERPAYRILSIHGFFGPDDNLYGENTEIYFDDEPNEEMEPLNEPARIKLNEHLEKLDRLGKEAAEKAGRPWAGRPRGLDGALALATEVQRAEMSLMGAKREVRTIERMQEKDIPQTGAKKRGRPRLAID